MNPKTTGSRANPRRPRRARTGFALVVTLSLMVLLSILAVGLLSLSSVSLRSSSGSSAQQQARANARMALMMAIGQLQREMGPDSRISAPHDAGTTTGGMPRWTAVYEAWKNDSTTLPKLDPVSRVPTFRTWLVSGATGTSVATGEMIPLVGTKSLGASQTAADLVSAPLVRLSDPGKNGAIAWWTADEAAKAKINAGAATENFAAASNPLSDAQSAPRVGSQAIPELSTFEWKPKQRSAAVTTDTVNLAAGLSGSGIGNLNHDLTLVSAGVLSDVREGRLKRDLSNLLTRPVEEVENKPLYLADGRLNRFVIGADGSVTNAPGTPANERLNGTVVTPRTADGWGINLEELFLFHNLHREIEWTGNQPKIVSKSTRELAVVDRFFLYRQPVIDAAQFTLSLMARSPTGTPPTHQMDLMIDGMIAISNPNDVTFEYARGLYLPIHIEKIPYRITWDIKRGGTVLHSHSPPTNKSILEYFRGYVEGAPPAVPAGFSLEPGESGVFGSTTGNQFIVNASRGFKPSGGVRLATYGLGPPNPDPKKDNLPLTGLETTDTINFRMNRENNVTANNVFTPEFNASPYCYLVTWLGPRAALGKLGWGMGGFTPHDSAPDNPFVNQRFPLVIQPSQVRPVSDFVLKPQPILLMSYIRNVEQDASGTGTEAFASRPQMMGEPGNSVVGMSMTNLETSSHVSQLIFKVEPLNYQFRTLAAGAGGRNLYHGGSRQINQGGSFNVIKRRIPLAPPLSLAAFENAIASGFSRRFKDQALTGGNPPDPWPSNAVALCGYGPALPVVAKAIGNSYASPLIPPGQIYEPVKVRIGGTDHSWMVNNALWDTWFLSGIVDGRGLGSNPFQTDGRSPRAQFSDLAKGTGLLRNQRFLFHPHKSPDDALTELFTGDLPKPSAINDLSKYLLVDGAFNVNSTSAAAWKALLSSLRDQELIVSGGAKQAFNNPYGTLGYAQDTSSTNDWTGLRDISKTDIDSLAKAIVEEVKARGPFLNLGDFVNRRPNGSSAEQAVGALQAAIDKSGLNSRFTGGGRSVAEADFGTLPGRSAVSAEEASGRARSVGSAGHLTQARLLTALGPQITVRSDTFLIRTYGDARDAAGNILAKAWCEAVVQRMPEYVDPTDRPEAAEGWPTSGDKLTTANSLFGRRLEILSFRWLSGDEI